MGSAWGGGQDFGKVKCTVKVILGVGFRERIRIIIIVSVRVRLELVLRLGIV